MEDTNLITHLESELGTITGGWEKFPEGPKWQFQVISMCNGRFHSITAFSTLGLSRFPLSVVVSGRRIYQELFMLMPDYYGPRNIPALLYDIGNYALNRKQAYLRGDVIDFNSGIALSETKFTSFYVASPVYYPDSFAAFDNIAICWLIPIYQEENIFIKENGWEKFENLLQKHDPNFLDINRPSVIKY